MRSARARETLDMKSSTTKVTKAKKSAASRKPTTAHPPYAEMIKAAITTLKERSGSSLYAIGKFVEDKHKAHLPSNFRKILLLQLKKLAGAGKLTKVKGSYKISTVTTAAHSAPAKPVVALKKPAASPAKPKAAASTKPKAKIATKPPKRKPTAIAPKAKVAAAKRKSPAKPKPKSAARPAKAVKTSAKASPGKKAAPAKLKAKAVKPSAKKATPKKAKKATPKKAKK